MKCEIIRDLLPSYVDGLTSRESDRAIEEHLKGCRSAGNTWMR
ncbi:MAG: zf-HC2 domain-containing protein [Blautia marasmi]